MGVEEATAAKSKGFQSWCSVVDEKFDDNEKDSPLIDRHMYTSY
jgi:hypothetical protein